METNPFTVLTFIAAPAVLTNASSVLALGTSNRIARAVDRARELGKLLEAPDLDPELAELWEAQLGHAERRCQFLMRALKSFYLSLGAFAAASLASLIGAVLSATNFDGPVKIAMIGVMLIGTFGFCSLVFGCALLVEETSITLKNIGQEGIVFRRRHARRK